ncbi:MAG: hypothetical protein ACT4P2_14575 [Pseudomonadota bacterium]
MASPAEPDDDGYHAMLAAMRRFKEAVERRELDYAADRKYRPDQRRWPAETPGSSGGRFAPEDGGFIRYLRTGDRRPQRGPSAPRANEPTVSEERMRAYYGPGLDAFVRIEPPPYPPRNQPIAPADWDKLKEALEASYALSPTERFAYAETLAAEGGLKVDSNGASSGITRSTLRDAQESRRIPEIRGVGTPADLTPAQRLLVYKWYFDTQALKEVGGSARLVEIGNPFTAAAIADVLFREGGARGAGFIRNAIQKVVRNLSESERLARGLRDKISEIGVMKRDSFAAIVELSRAGYGDRLRDALAEQRENERVRETWRNDHFRFRGLP